MTVWIRGQLLVYQLLRGIGEVDQRLAPVGGMRAAFDQAATLERVK